MNSLSLSEDGQTLAIGDDASESPSISAGYVKVYKWSGNSWVQKGAALSGDELGDYFGSSVSLNSTGDVLAIGAEQVRNSGDYTGHAKVFIWDQNNWRQLGTTIFGEELTSHFGSSVSLNKSGNRVAIGARHEGILGAVYVYTFDGMITSTEEIDEELYYKIYPNPVQSTNNLYTKNKGDFKIDVYNLSGDLFSSKEYRSTNKVTLDYPSAPGVYMVIVTNTNSGKTNTIKVLKD